MTPFVRYLWVMWSFLACSFVGIADAGILGKIKPGTWFRVPNSKLVSVVPRPYPKGANAPISIMSDWSGGAFDSKRNRLIVWGGGHTDYSGNELYAFELKSLRWRRLTNPSRNVGGKESSGYYPDGKPRARHTYDYVEYIPPPFDRFCSFGGAAMYPSGGIIVKNVDCFNFSKRKWERMQDSPAYSIGALSAYDPVKNEVWVHSVGNVDLFAKYIPGKNKWKSYGSKGGSSWIDYEYTAEIDPVQRLFVAVGHGSVLVKRLGSGGSFRKLRTKGAVAIQKADSPGLAYDPKLKKLVAWSGGANLYILDLKNKTWIRQRPAKTNKHIPPKATEVGIFGRFRYIPKYDLFIAVTDVKKDVYLYRMKR